MHLLTPDGHRTIQAGWPYEGIRSPGMQSQGLNRITMVGSRGQSRSATYRDIYLTNPWVWAAVNTIARGAARAPIKTYLLDPDGGRTRVRGDVPVGRGRPSAGAQLDRLLHFPNPETSRRAMVEATFKNRLLYGNGLWTIDRDRFGVPTALWRPSWRDVVVHEGVNRPIAFYEITPHGVASHSTHFPAVGEFGGSRSPLRGGARRYSPDDVVHFGRGTDDDAVAPSPLEACRHTIALHEAVVRHLIAFFENQARPSGYFKVDRVSKNAEAIRELITELYTSPENAGKVLVSSGEWKSLTTSADQSKVIELIELSRVEIAAAYAIPPPVLGILDRAIKSNVVELRSQHVRDAVGQPAAEFEDELMAQLVNPTPAWRHHFVELDFAEQLRPDMEARAGVHEKTRHFMTPDEQRAVENLSPLELPGVSDVPWVDSGASPMTAFSADAVADRVAEKVAARLTAGGSNGHTREEPIHVL